ncbi:hypothetical protein M6B38_383690 [Iris pallida]|uniref:Uncharacterized protein n=1 Tax=Iris pallida TaxID=29817 RepID=A0AAX6ERM0_IRIPA|nr:hypothetical protein M6B38_107150 [Iris pallida]KAJ6823446.1 hypothetical protein M6B38_383690 [Iris pallida]
MAKTPPQRATTERPSPYSWTTATASRSSSPAMARGDED